jgi:ATP-dependent RNA helicase RhlE
MLFSATMPIALMEVAYEEILRDPTHVEVGSQSIPPAAISQSVYLVSPSRKTELLLTLLRREAMESVLVFVRTRRGAHRLATHLKREQIGTACVHGDRSQREREQALKSFKQRSVRVLVATDVAARGLHVDGVTHVINYDVPSMPAEYLNRIGRTARAGASGEALTLVTRQDALALASIERSLGRSLPRVTAAGLTEPEFVRPSPRPRTSRLRAPGSRRTAGRRRRR